MMNSRKTRILSVIIAVVMVMTSAIGVFATSESSMQGTNNANTTVGNVSKGTIAVTASGPVQYSVDNGKTWKTATSGTIKGLKGGQFVNIKTAAGTTYRWMKTTKIKKAKKKKATWKKVKGAKWYLVQVTKGGKTYYARVKGTSVKSSKFKKQGLKSLKGAKVKVRPLTIKNGHVYAGVLCKAKKAK